MRSAAWWVAILLAGGCAEEAALPPIEVADPPPPEDPCPPAREGAAVRVFVVGHAHAIEQGESYASYRASYEAHMKAIAPCLRDDVDNLVVFPDGAGLVAQAIGSRGAEARAASSSTEAFAAGSEAYEPLADFWSGQYPGLSAQRNYLLAVSDVVWRATLDTFGSIAREHGVWVLTSTDVPEMARTPAPYLVQQIADPDLANLSAVYVPISGDVYDRAVLFTPAGELAGRVDKIFLDDAEEQALDLSNGDFSTVSPIATRFGDVAIAAGRDAFYAPFMQRMEDLGVDLVIQPSALSGWTIEAEAADWLPDAFVASGWHHTQKYGAVLASLAPQLTGNLYEMVFDGQVHVTAKAGPGGAELAYVGQEPLPGWQAIGPWAAADPVATDPALALDERRATLRGIGDALRPGSGDERENGYAESLLIADLDLARAAVDVEPDATLPPSAAIGGAGEQRLPEVVSDGADRVLVVWQQGRGISARVVYALSGDAGETFSEPTQVFPDGDFAQPQRRPAACMDAAGRALVVWQHGHPGTEQTTAAALASDGTFEAPVRVYPSLSAQWQPSCGFLAGDRVAVVWSDFLSGSPRVYMSRRLWSAPSFDAGVAVDASAPPADARLHGAQLMPWLSPQGGHVVWLDHRERGWDVYHAHWDGAAFTPAVRIDGVASSAERLHGEPRVVAAAGNVLVAWTDLHDGRAHSDIAWAASNDDGQTWSPHIALPGGPEELGGVSSGGGALSRFRPALALDARAGVASVLFQDLAPHKSAIFAAAIGAAIGEPVRFDDTGAAAVSLTHPSAAFVRGGLLVVWEDDRDGAPRIYRAVSKP